MGSVLVTGGAGFIGSHTCDRLLERGDQVVCIDNFNDYYDPDIKKDNIAGAIQNNRFRLYSADILDEEILQHIFRDHDIEKIIHLAARAGVRPSIEDPHLYQDVNIRGTLNFLEMARQKEIKNFVFASSSSVYGGNTKVPFSEDDLVDKPVSPYAATKKAGELFCHVYNHLYGIDVSCLRFFTVYGPRGRPDMAPYIFLKKVLEDKHIERFGDGSSSRDYTYVDDVVDGILAASDRNEGFEVFNLGNSSPVDLNTFIGLIEEVSGKEAKVQELPEQPGDVDRTYADISKARSLLGYDPETSLEEGLEKFHEWYIQEVRGREKL